MRAYIGDWLVLAGQFLTFGTALIGVIVSLRAVRKVTEVHDLVNGKTERLEKLIEAKGYRAGVAAEKRKSSK